jgi:hypothetical protein
VIGVGSLAHELEDLRREADASRKEWARRETKGDPNIGAASDAVGPDARPDDSDGDYRALAFATDATQISKAPKKRDGINMDSVALSKGNCVSLDRNLRATA